MESPKMKKKLKDFNQNDSILFAIGHLLNNINYIMFFLFIGNDKIIVNITAKCAMNNLFIQIIFLRQ